jgi:hypothetical protein
MPRSPIPMTHTDVACSKRRRRRTDAARSRSEDGQALVEFALVLPIVLAVLLGVLLFGVALNNWIDETQLTSAAARWASVNNEHGLHAELNEAAFLKWVTESSGNGEIAKAKATMCSPTSEVGDYVEVKLAYNYKWFGLAGLLGTRAETPLESTAQMRIEDKPLTPYPTTC